MGHPGVIERVIDKALAIADGGRPVMVDVNIDYSRKTTVRKGVLKVNLGRFPLKQKIRFIGRAASRIDVDPVF